MLHALPVYMSRLNEINLLVKSHKLREVVTSQQEQGEIVGPEQPQQHTTIMKLLSPLTSLNTVVVAVTLPESTLEYTSRNIE